MPRARVPVIDRFRGHNEGGKGVGDSLIKVGTDVQARPLGFSGVNFCPGIVFSEENFARPLDFCQFVTKNV